MRNSRCGNVDLAKFIGALLIMSHHLFLIGLSDYKFRNSWIYVEFFLIITGYYTAKHFDGKAYNNSIKESLIYTLKKFIPLLPYTSITTFLMYLLKTIPNLVSGELNIKGFIFSFTDNLIFDVLLVIESYSTPAVASLWYLSAMVICFPLFSWLMQIKNRYWIMIIASMYSLFYYGIIGVSGNRTYPNDIFRVFAGMCIGAVIYEVVYAFSDYINKLNKVFLTTVEVTTFLFPIISNYNNLGAFRFILFCYMVCLSIMLPGLSYTSNIRGKAFTYLGKLSVPVFVIHWFIGSIVALLSGIIMVTTITKLILYYGGTIIVSMVAMYFVDHWKWFNDLIGKPIVLKD